MFVQMGHCQERNACGALKFQKDPGTGDAIDNASGNLMPLMEDFVQSIGGLFNIWHNLDEMEVLQSC